MQATDQQPESEQSSPNSQRQRASQTIRLLLIFVLLGSLFAITGLRQFFLDPIDSNTINTFWFALQVAPLLILLPNLLQGSRNSFVYCALVSLLYFVHGVMQSGDADLGRLGILEAGLALALSAVASLAAKTANALATGPAQPPPQ